MNTFMITMVVKDNFNVKFVVLHLKKLPKELNPVDKHKYKLHYIYREFNINFFKMNL